MSHSDNQQHSTQSNLVFQMWDRYLTLLNSIWSLDAPSHETDESDAVERTTWSTHVHELNQQWHVPATLSLPEPHLFPGKLLHPVKKFILRVMQPAIETIIRQQNEFNAKTVQTFNSLRAQQEFNAKVVQAFNGLVELTDSEIRQARTDMSHHLTTFQTTLDSFQTTLNSFQKHNEQVQDHLEMLQDHLDNRLEQIEPRLDAFELMVWTFDRRKEALEIEQILLAQKLEKALSAIHANRPEGDSQSEKQVPAPSSRSDYRSFLYDELSLEDESHVKDRQTAYLPYFKECRHVLTLGCGRGEFLELLQEGNITAQAIEQNQIALEYCRKKQLTVTEGDSLTYLASLTEDSLDGIFSDRAITYYAPKELQTLLELCHAKLQTHHYLVIETANPQSVSALTDSFRFPCAHKPFHPDALTYLLKTVGFQNISIEYTGKFADQDKLQTLDITEITDDDVRTQLEILNTDIDRLNHLLYGQPYYAVIAKKVKMH